ncbi:hypothetical protein BGW80DRAFT_1283098 [Lactifluus volemus]|nr:hypothetical protein BGW80DRAFT_1283098 [Lactifluus volemus]
MERVLGWYWSWEPWALLKIRTVQGSLSVVVKLLRMPSPSADYHRAHYALLKEIKERPSYKRGCDHGDITDGEEGGLGLVLG